MGTLLQELPSFIIRRLPLRFTYDNNYFNSRYQGIPVEGYTAIVEKCSPVQISGLNTDYFAHKEELSALAHKTVFTGMLDEYFGFCYGSLEYRSVRFEEERLECDNYQGNAVVNYTDREVPYTRIIEHKHFTFGTQPFTIISREYSSEWKPGIEPYYPINDSKNSRSGSQISGTGCKERAWGFLAEDLAIINITIWIRSSLPHSTVPMQNFPDIYFNKAAVIASKQWLLFFCSP